MYLIKLLQENNSINSGNWIAVATRNSITLHEYSELQFRFKHACNW